MAAKQSKKIEKNGKTGTWISRRLQNTHDHFTCFLPKSIGFFSSFLLNLLYSGIKIKDEQLEILEQLPEEAVAVYINKHKSRFEFLFYHSRFKKLGLSFPELAFGYKIITWQPISRLLRILLAHTDYFLRHFSLPDPYKRGYIKNELNKGRVTLLSLVEKKGFYYRFVKDRIDPIEHLIEIQKTINRPIILMPLLMFFSKKPHRAVPTLTDILFGPEQKPGRLRRTANRFRKSGKVFVEVSQPINIETFLSDSEHIDKSVEHLALILRRNILYQINNHRRSITGPVLKSREELKESILTNDRLRRFMENHSKKRGVPIKTVRKKANAYLREIAANYNPAFIKIGAYIVKWLLFSIFDGVTVDQKGLQKVKRMSQKGPVILIPCHKSHIDYLILPFVLYQNNMPCPHTVGGINLFFWPIGGLLRRLGAFSIRRSFRGAVFYTKVYSEYIHKLLKEGFNIELFFEGTRSRTGKLITPKLGFLTILLSAYKTDACDDMIFAPINIGYDRVPEENAYLHEVNGGDKKPESFSQMIKARKILKKKYGKIYLNFHQPYSLKELLAQNGSSIHEMTPKEQNKFCRNLGHRIISSIERVTVVTPYSLISSAVLNHPYNKFTFEQLNVNVMTYLKYLISQSILLSDNFSHDTERVVHQILDHFVHRKFIERIPVPQEETTHNRLYKINETRRPNLEYYKNNVVGIFIPGAFTALSILVMGKNQFDAPALHENYLFLENIFKNEFTSHIDMTPEYLVRKNIKAFIEESMITPHPTLPDTYTTTPAGIRKLGLFSAFLKTYFESYWIVLNFFKQYTRNSTDPKERLKKIQSMGSSMYRDNQINCREALSKINYQNAIDFYITQGVRGTDDKEKIEFYTNAIQKHLNHLHS